MKTGFRRLSVAALTLVVCLSFSPDASAVVVRDHDDSFHERVVKILKKAKKFFGSIGTLEDALNPPRP
jgi:hypothetical protein